MTGGAIAGAFAAAFAGDPLPPPDPQQIHAATAVFDQAELSFDRAFFEAFRPSSALDMINRVPGFSYHKGDGGIRGLAGASGNVLIDGQRPVVKSVSLDDVIRRIPADAVLRIEVVRGGSAKLDMQGHAVVANIVRDPSGFLSVTGEVMTKFYTDHRPGRHGRLEAAMSRGDLAMNGALVWRDEKEQANTGVGRADRIDVVNGRRSRGRFETAWDREVVQANGSIEYDGGLNLFRVNVSGELEDNLQRDETRLGGLGGEHEEAVIRDFQSDQAEISVDYERTVSDTLGARLLALKRTETDRTRSHSYGRGQPQTSREKAVEDESILRLAATWRASAALTWDASAEGSINVLDKTSALIRAGMPVDLPSDEIRVEERRANLDSGLRWQARDGLSLEVGLGYETSTIGQTGDVEQSRSLRYWKPRANLTIDPVRDVQLRLRAEQIVGQLNFSDFAASISLEPGAVSAGNPDLVPERRWLFEAAVEHRFWDRGAVTLSVSHAEVRDVVDLIPIDNRFDAPGNIGGGVRQELKLSFTLPLERLAVPGGLVRFNGTWRRSEVVDPVTGKERRISWERPFAGDLVISKDLPGLDSVIGADIFMGFKEVSYRLHERRSERSTSDPLARLYWDWTPDPKTTLRIQVENMTFRKRSQERIFYWGPRAHDDIAAIERRSATLDPFLMLRLRRRL